MPDVKLMEEIVAVAQPASIPLRSISAGSGILLNVIVMPGPDDMNGSAIPG